VISKDTVVNDLAAWISKFRRQSGYRVVEVFVNPYLKSHLENGGWWSLRWKWK
jgi:hypothetical protein